MKDEKIQTFMKLAGQKVAQSFQVGDDEQRKLGAQLLLSEVLEYVIKGLGVTPVVSGTPIEDPNGLAYEVRSSKPDHLEMLDGLADVAYTMYWNSCAFGLRLEEAFELVCDNNLEKFVKLDGWSTGEKTLSEAEWDLGIGVTWPEEVVEVSVLQVGAEFYATGKDKNGKVRKPSSYKSVDLKPLLS